MDKVSNNNYYETGFQQNNKKKNPYLSALLLGSAMGAASTGIDLYISSKGKESKFSKEILEIFGSGLAWSRDGGLIKNEKFLKFARNKWGALALGVMGGALGLLTAEALIQGIKGIFMRRRSKD